ncbi:MAG: hypothetical protein RDU20_12320 [Desulfomonilaceae bacterium]|nr:hypothetical protein [Desulfomonilaceae bacterium]
MPADLIEDLKRVAPTKGMSRYQPLMKFYISQVLRQDLQQLWEAEQQLKKLEALLEKLRLNDEEKHEIRQFLRDIPKARTA